MSSSPSSKIIAAKNFGNVGFSKVKESILNPSRQKAIKRVNENHTIHACFCFRPQKGTELLDSFHSSKS
jgi:hypothetical protein